MASTELEPVFDLPDDIVGLDQYTEHIFAMVYGDGGVGKTVLGGSARSLIIATEKGTVSAARQGSKAKVWDCTNDWNKVVEAYEWCAENAGKPGFPFDWIVVDTATTMEQLILEDIVAQRAEVSAKNSSLDKVQLEEYGEQQNRFMRYIKLFGDLDVNVLLLAHEMVRTNEEGVDFKLPNFHGKGYQVSQWVCAQVHAYGRLQAPQVVERERDGKKVKVRVRRIQWQPSETVKAKDRFDALGSYTESKTLAQITRMIEDSASVETPAPTKAPAKKAAGRVVADAPQA